MNLPNAKTSKYFRPHINYSIENKIHGLWQVHQGEVPMNDQNIITAYCIDLKKILEINVLSSMIDNLFELEDALNAVNAQYEYHFLPQGPSLDQLYLQLSPLLLQSLVNHEENDLKNERWREILRVAIEEELYHWKNILENL
jgi:hypothetical protein